MSKEAALAAWRTLGLEVGRRVARQLALENVASAHRRLAVIKLRALVPVALDRPRSYPPSLGLDSLAGGRRYRPSTQRRSA